MEFDYEAEIKELNSFLTGIKRYDTTLDTIRDLLSFKQIFQKVNNMITYRVTQKFASEIEAAAGIDSFSNRMNVNENLPHPNNVGFDLDRIEGFDTVDFKYIAEVKCNVPLSSTGKFGSNQKRGINSDIDKLLKEDADCYRFMVILDADDEGRTVSAVRNLIDSRKANDEIKLIGSANAPHDLKSVIRDKPSKVIYVYLIKPDFAC